MGEKIMIFVIWGFLGSARGKEPTCLHRRRDAGVILGRGRSWRSRMAPYSRILAWGTLWTEEPGSLESIELDMTEAT